MTAIALKSADVRLRLSPDLKQSASDILMQCGLDISSAVRLFLQNVVAYKGIPFELKLPNQETLASMQEAKSIRNPRFASAEALFDDLDKVSRSKAH